MLDTQLPTLSPKDEREITKDLEITLLEIDDRFAINGEPLDEEKQRTLT